MRALSIEWLEHNNTRARVLGILIAQDGSVLFHVKTWPKARPGVTRAHREEVWTFDQITPFVQDSGRTARAGQKAGLL